MWYRIVHAQDKDGKSFDEQYTCSQSGTTFDPRGTKDWEVPLSIYTPLRIQSWPCDHAPSSRKTPQGGDGRVVVER